MYLTEMLSTKVSISDLDKIKIETEQKLENDVNTIKDVITKELNAEYVNNIKIQCVKNFICSFI